MKNFLLTFVFSILLSGIVNVHSFGKMLDSDITILKNKHTYTQEGVATLKTYFIINTNAEGISTINLTIDFELFVIRNSAQTSEKLVSDPFWKDDSFYIEMFTATSESLKHPDILKKKWEQVEIKNLLFIAKNSYPTETSGNLPAFTFNPP